MGRRLGHYSVTALCSSASLQWPNQPGTCISRSCWVGLEGPQDGDQLLDSSGVLGWNSQQHPDWFTPLQCSRKGRGGVCGGFGLAAPWLLLARLLSPVQTRHFRPLNSVATSSCSLSPPLWSECMGWRSQRVRVCFCTSKLGRKSGVCSSWGGEAEMWNSAVCVRSSARF